MIPIQTILHATDLSESAKHALRLACSLARDQEARLVILHVVPPPYPIVSDMLVVPPVPVEEPAADIQKGFRERIETLMPACKALPVEYRVEKGDIVERILAVAAEVDAGLVVVGTHGRTGLGRVLMGSVAEQVVRRAPASVLTVKTPVARKPAARPVEAERPLLATPY